MAKINRTLIFSPPGDGIMRANFIRVAQYKMGVQVGAVGAVAREMGRGLVTSPALASF